MPNTTILLFREADGRVPLVDWLNAMPDKARDKCVARLLRLGERGHELRRPEADFLRNGVYELRVGLQGTNYRKLYFLHGNMAAIVSHGLVKERQVPPREIDRAIERMRQYLSNPARYSTEMML
jgi:phage-related protein